MISIIVLKSICECFSWCAVPVAVQNLCTSTLWVLTVQWRAAGQELIFYKGNYLARLKGTAGFPSLYQTLNKTSIFFKYVFY